MSNIFLSYAREDREKAERLARALEGQGWSVWWDFKIRFGQTFDRVIEEALADSRCVLVLWSKRSVDSDWVRTEAAEGQAHRVLIPVLLEQCLIPLAFRRIQTADLTGWDGGKTEQEFQRLVDAIGEVLGEDTAKPVPTTRPKKGPPKKGLAKRKTPERPPAPTWAEDEKLNRRILIKGGEFLMGSPVGVGPDSEHPQHRVRLSSFYVQEHPVTSEEYRRFRPTHQYRQGEERHPAVNVSWGEAAEYAEWLGGRLPTEAEWEYACRAGTDTSFWSGDSGEHLERVGWYERNSGDHPHPVGEKSANPWGLYDMHGNVSEWVADWSGPHASDLQVDPVNEDSSSGRRVIRGGSFNLPAGNARSASRFWLEPDVRVFILGFRVAFDAAPSDKKD